MYFFVLEKVVIIGSLSLRIPGFLKNNKNIPFQIWTILRF